MKTKEQIRTLAQQAFKNHLEYLSSGRITEWVDLFTNDGILEFPYGPADFPKHVEGKQSLYEYMKNFPEHFKVQFENLHFHVTEDPTLVIAEFTSSGHAISTGKPYNQKYISVVTTNEDGEIIKYVDFWNPMVAMEAINAPLASFVEGSHA
ncbi:nuclear transport factor 2 family protein [Cytophagaceae bacterium DM2B3-1]|uniref:Nuclear transport factor 2 family protein n=1 Tax=Xanthocytophaga flava TaxID=3048013 RepID=A0ABT7CDV0_9BACT|nr:nuclear transport factor 2 family protein [Xanthocytophaga flavus]MDJ1472725.1 nuclear transport factor 2 family protein [Xanthocytophaga flavus]MDJ1491906.1 nuclear transport factor 2 family protein [Xanthocytophaga flavus]